MDVLGSGSDGGAAAGGGGLNVVEIGAGQGYWMSMLAARSRARVRARTLELDANTFKAFDVMPEADLSIVRKAELFELELDEVVRIRKCGDELRAGDIVERDDDNNKNKNVLFLCFPPPGEPM